MQAGARCQCDIDTRAITDEGYNRTLKEKKARLMGVEEHDEEIEEEGTETDDSRKDDDKDEDNEAKIDQTPPPKRKKPKTSTKTGIIAHLMNNSVSCCWCSTSCHTSSYICTDNTRSEVSSN
jgi:hypothetical protein